MDNRKLIVWDLDDVLNDFTRDWLELGWKAEHPECQVRFEDLHTNPPLQALGVTLEEYVDSIGRFRLGKFGPVSSVNWSVLEWFKEHGARFRHAVLTARQGQSVVLANTWLKMHFSRWIDGIYSVTEIRPRYFLSDVARGKAQWLRRSGATVFVDDSQPNMEAAAGAGIRSLLFPQPWNYRALLAQQGVLDELARLA